MIITISGLPGSGKTTVGKLLAEKLGCKFYSIGELRRKWAAERGMKIDELNKLGEKEDWTDRKAEEWQVEVAKNDDNIVLDGRVSFHFIPKSFKVFLTVDPGVGAERVFGDIRDDEKTESVEQLKDDLRKRTESDNIRYKKHYGLEFLDGKNYETVIDTTNMTPEDAAEKIIREVEKHSGK